ncbi:amidase [Pseudomonas citronellolis]|uniref:amidase n=1 Tax=Pseudomonas citronellolis TaxID=53408 RepID=UPI0023E43660|nr:amidase [Pseudomonas citronellolis]MDF3935648.1 amidase [Pseudomonas citronellolis]
MTALHDLTAVQLLALYRSRQLSPVEYLRHLIAHIERWEPQLCALYAYAPERALGEAREAEARWLKGEPRGELDGVPVTIKELIASAGDPIPQGSAAVPLTPASQDAPPTARLREAGAILLGKTTVPDFGMLSSGLSSFHKLARNPWNLAMNPGGSSAGAASAAAAGYGPLHLGTDIGGSVRLPAAWCGLVGFKPSLGRIPIDPYYTGRCAGPMTRSLDDAALLMKHLARPDWRDATSLPPAELDWAIRPAEVRGLRIGLQLDPGCGLQPEPEVRRAVEDAAQRFVEAGAQVVEVQPILDRELLDGLDRFWRARLWAELGALPAERQARVLPYIFQWAEGGARVSGVEAVRGFNCTFEMRKRAAEQFHGVDFLLSPTNQVAAFPVDWASPTNDPARPFEHIGFTVPWNMSEQPALSINCGFTAAGMPIGLQIVGPRFADVEVLALGKAYETWRGDLPGWPQPPERG